MYGETIKLGREQVNRLYESANENFVKRRGGKGATVSHLIWKRGINSLGESLLPLFGTFLVQVVIHHEDENSVFFKLTFSLFLHCRPKKIHVLFIIQVVYINKVSCLQSA